MSIDTDSWNALIPQRRRIYEGWKTESQYWNADVIEQLIISEHANAKRAFLTLLSVYTVGRERGFGVACEFMLPSGF